MAFQKVERLLAQLQLEEIYTDEYASETVIKDIASTTRGQLSPEERGACSSAILSSPTGLIAFLRESLKRQPNELVRLRTEVMRFVAEYIESIGSSVAAHAAAVAPALLHVIRGEKRTTIKKFAYAPFLQLLRCGVDAQTLDVERTVRLLFKELAAARSKQSQTERGGNLHILGVISEHYPEFLRGPEAERYAGICMSDLATEARASSPEPTLVAGIFDGLASFLVHHGDKIKPKARKKAMRREFLFECVYNGLHSVEVTRYAVLQAAMHLLARHAALFRPYIVSKCDSVLSMVLAACKHKNNAVKETGSTTLEALLAELAVGLADDYRSGVAARRANAKSLFKLLLTYFNARLDSDDDGELDMHQRTEEKSMCIRAFGQLASAIVVFMSEEELSKFLHRLLQHSERLYSGRPERVVVATKHFPAFLSAYANILVEMSTVDPAVLRSLSYIVGRLFLVYPSMHSKHRRTNNVALTRLFVVLFSKGVVFRHLLNDIVFQGLTLTISRLPEISDVGTENAHVFQQKIGYVEYGNLWEHLLFNRDPEWHTGLNLPIELAEQMQDVVYDYLVVAVMRMLRTLNLDVQQESANASSSSSSSTPALSKDFELFNNLIEFFQLIFLGQHRYEKARGGATDSVTSISSPSPIAGLPRARPYDAYLEELRVKRFSRWIFIIGKMVIELSDSLPHIAGYYTLMEVVMRICSEFGYFAGLNVSAKAELEGSVGRGPSIDLRTRSVLSSAQAAAAAALSAASDDSSMPLSLSLSRSASEHDMLEMPSLLSLDSSDIDYFDSSFGHMMSSLDAAPSPPPSPSQPQPPQAPQLPRAPQLPPAQFQDSPSNRRFCWKLFFNYLRDVVVRVRQFRAELLFATCRFVLSVPREFVDIPLLLPPLIRCLHLGLSFQPAAVVAISVLNSWLDEMPHELLAHAPDILPHLSSFMRPPKSAADASTVMAELNDTEADVEDAQAATEEARARAAVLGADARVNEVDPVDRDIVRRVLNFLGRIGGRVVHVVGGADSEDTEPTATIDDGDSGDTTNLTAKAMTQSALAWDSENHVKLELPFAEQRIAMYLDPLLPRICFLAEKSPDRATKASACEALHGIVVYIIAQRATVKGRTPAIKNPTHKLYARMFPTMLRLATDIDSIARQLFQPLMLQVVHWFTNNKTNEQDETMALLDAITDAVGSPTDQGLREFSAKCLAEFLKYSLKQAHQAATMSRGMNVKSLLRRLYSLAHHPNPYKRLGAALTFTRIYRQFREQKELVSMFFFDIMRNLLFSLRLADSDDPSLGTVDHTTHVINALARTVTDPKEGLAQLLRNPDPNRTGGGVCATLNSFVEYLFRLCGSREDQLRRTCFRLFLQFSPHTSGTPTPPAWLLSFQPDLALGGKTAGLSTVHEEDEDADGDLEMNDRDINNDAPIGQAKNPVVAVFEHASLVLDDSSFDSDDADKTSSLMVRHRAILRWLHDLAPALDAYAWCVREGLYDAATLLSDDAGSTLLPAVTQFSSYVSRVDELEQSVPLLSAERLAFRNTFCTVAIRAFRFLHVLLLPPNKRAASGSSSAAAAAAAAAAASAAASSSHTIVPQVWDLLTDEFFAFTLKALLVPAELGFTTRARDCQAAIGNLLACLVPPPGAADPDSPLSSPQAERARQRLFDVGRHMLSKPQFNVTELQVDKLLDEAHAAADLTLGFTHLYTSRVLPSVIGAQQCSNAAHYLAQQAFEVASRSRQQATTPLHVDIGRQMLFLALYIGVSPAVLTQLLCSDQPAPMDPAAAGGADDGVTKGELFYSSYQLSLDKHLMKNAETHVAPLLKQLHCNSHIQLAMATLLTSVARVANRAARTYRLSLNEAASYKRRVRKFLLAFVPAFARVVATRMDEFAMFERHSGAVATTASRTLNLLSQLLDLDAYLILHSSKEWSDVLLHFYLRALKPNVIFANKQVALQMLPHFLTRAPVRGELTHEFFQWRDTVQSQVVAAVQTMTAYRPFPVSSRELADSGNESLWHEYTILFQLLLTALVKSQSMPLLEALLGAFRERRHIYIKRIRTACLAMIDACNKPGQFDAITTIIARSFSIFLDPELDDNPEDNARRFVLHNVLLPALQRAPKSVKRQFFVNHASTIVSKVLSFKGSTADNAEALIAARSDAQAVNEWPMRVVQLMELEGCYKLIEYLYMELDGDYIKKEVKIEYKKLLPPVYEHAKKPFAWVPMPIDSKKQFFRRSPVHDCQTAAYAALTAIILRTQTRSDNMVRVCLQNSRKGDMLWHNIMAWHRPLDLPLESNFARCGPDMQPIAESEDAAAASKVASEDGQVGTAERLRKLVAPKNTRYLSHQYYADSSLSQDVSGMSPFYREAEVTNFAADSRHRPPEGLLYAKQIDADGSSAGDSLDDGAGGKEEEEEEEETRTLTETQMKIEATLKQGRSARQKLFIEAMRNKEAFQLDSFNRNPAMATMLKLIDHITALDSANMPSGMPMWMRLLLDRLVAPTDEGGNDEAQERLGAAIRQGDPHTVPPSIASRWFVVKIVINRWHLFTRFASEWFKPIVDLVCDERNGAYYSFHYMLRDVCFTFLKWIYTSDWEPDRDFDATERNNTASRFVGQLMRVAYDAGMETTVDSHGRVTQKLDQSKQTRTRVLQSNLGLIKIFIEEWKDCLTLDPEIVWSMLDVDLSQIRREHTVDKLKLLTGLELVSILVLNGLGDELFLNDRRAAQQPPQLKRRRRGTKSEADEDADESMDGQPVRSLLDLVFRPLESPKPSKPLYEACSEVIGLIVDQEDPDEDLRALREGRTIDELGADDDSGLGSAASSSRAARGRDRLSSGSSRRRRRGADPRDEDPLKDNAYALRMRETLHSIFRKGDYGMYLHVATCVASRHPRFVDDRMLNAVTSVLPSLHGVFVTKGLQLVYWYSKHATSGYGADGADSSIPPVQIMELLRPTLVKLLERAASAGAMAQLTSASRKVQKKYRSKAKVVSVDLGTMHMLLILFERIMHTLYQGGGVAVAAAAAAGLIDKDKYHVKAQAMVNEWLPKLIEAFAEHPDTRCRELLFKMLIWVWDQVQLAGPVESVVKGVLLGGMADKSVDIRAALYQFWNDSNRIETELAYRLKGCVTTLYHEAAHRDWVQYCTYLLMNLTSRSADFEQRISDQPLDDCEFQDVRVSTSKPSFSLSMPGASATQSSADEFGHWSLPAASKPEDEDDEDDDGDTIMSQLVGSSDTAATAATSTGAAANSRRLKRNLRAVQAAARQAPRRGEVLATVAPQFEPTMQPFSQGAFTSKHASVMNASQGDLFSLSLTLGASQAGIIPRGGGGRASSIAMGVSSRTWRKQRRRNRNMRGVARSGMSQAAGGGGSSSSAAAAAGGDVLMGSYAEFMATVQLPRRFTRESAAHRRIQSIRRRDERSRYHQAFRARQQSSRDRQVNLFRSYRRGELPDVQIPLKHLLLPLQALHTDPVIAKHMLVNIAQEVYKAIEERHGQHDDGGEEQDSPSKLRSDIYSGLVGMLSDAARRDVDPSLVFCIHLTLLRLHEVDLESAVPVHAETPERINLPTVAHHVGQSALRTNNFHSAILTLEHLLDSAEWLAARFHPAAKKQSSSRKKRRRTSASSSSSAPSSELAAELQRVTGHCLALLYRSLGEEDVVRSLHGQFSTQKLTADATEFAMAGNIEAAVELYEGALDKVDGVERLHGGDDDDEDEEDVKPRIKVEWTGAREPPSYEVDLWRHELVEGYRELTNWDEVYEIAMEQFGVAQYDEEDEEDDDEDVAMADAQADKRRAARLRKVVAQAFSKSSTAPHSQYLRHYLDSTLKTRGKWRELVDFISLAREDEGRQELLEAEFPMHLVSAYAVAEDVNRARYYVGKAHDRFLRAWDSLPLLATGPRRQLLHELQPLVEASEFVELVEHLEGDLSSEFEPALDRILTAWSTRFPLPHDPAGVWDDVIRSRTNYMSALGEHLRDESPQLVARLRAAALSTSRKGAAVMTAAKNFRAARNYLNQAKKALQLVAESSAAPPVEDLSILHADLELRRRLALEKLSSGDPARCVRMLRRVVRRLKIPQLEEQTEQLQPLLHRGDAGSLGDKPLEDVSGTEFFKVWKLRELRAKALEVIGKVLRDDDEDGALARAMRTQEPQVWMNEAEEDYQIAAFAFRHRIEYFVRSARGTRAAAAAASGSAKAVSLLGARLHSAAAEAFMQLAYFCERQLGMDAVSPLSDEVRAAPVAQLPVEARRRITETLVENVLTAMRFGSADGRGRFAVVLDRCAEFSSERAGDLLRKLSAEVPTWMFLQWVAQMLSVVSQPAQAPLVADILKRLAGEYPHAMYFPLNISRSDVLKKELKLKFSGGKTKGRKSSGRKKYKPSRALLLMQDLERRVHNPVLDKLVQELERLTHPTHTVKDFLSGINLATPEGVERTVEEFQVLEQQGLVDRQHDGTVADKFAAKFGKKLVSLFGRGGSKLRQLSDAAARKAGQKLQQELKRWGAKHLPRGGKADLGVFSRWLNDFETANVHTSSHYIELPGQYSGEVRPQPERHVRVVSFGPRLLVMSSLRKPKRLTVHASDERSYRYLVKGGEDLRMDQRVEQLFVAMNAIMQADLECTKRDLSLVTYEVVPMSHRMGIIEWVDNTKPIKMMLQEELDRRNMGDLFTTTVHTYFDHVSSFGSKHSKSDSPSLNECYHNVLKHMKISPCITAFEKLEKQIPKDVLLRALTSMCATPESFLVVRKRFMCSYASFSMCAYVLGIGDRHLENWLVDERTGSIVPIDFGAAFGHGVLLPVPELIPIRYTRQFQNLMNPLNTERLLHQSMTHVMRALRSNSDVLLTILSIFVKEPNLDWVAMAEKTERKQRKKLEQLNSKRITSLSSLTSGSSTSSIGSTMGTLTQEGVLAEDKLRFYYENRILTVKSKLLGLHPSNIIVEELESSRAILRDSKLAEACRNVVRGLKGSPRAQDKWKQPKSIEEQISFILDLASDKNVLGRTWQGWMPWV